MPVFCVIMEEKLWAVHRMVYLEKFVFPGGEQEYAIARKRMAENGGAFGYLDNGYPCGLFPQRGLSELDFEPVTIVCGGNGSGKSTILNIVAEKLGLKRLAPRNGGELFAPYCAACAYRTGYDDEGEPLALPAGSRIVTSDDIFEYMLAARTRNEEIAEDTERGKGDYASLKYGESIRFSGWENYENFRLQVLARTKSLSRRKFLQKLAGKEVRLRSNGETALNFFAEMLQSDTLYLLDEPENSLSPKMQLKLKSLIEEKARYCGCQFLIATHSPFLLALERAKIYDLDSSPVTLKKWWELENTRAYFEFFYANRNLFGKE